MSESPEITEEEGLLPDSHLFTVRLWLEELGHDNAEWRGKVTHVLSGEADYFRKWSDLIDFLSQRAQTGDITSRCSPSRRTCGGSVGIVEGANGGPS